MNLALFTLLCVNFILHGAFLVWVVAEYRSTGQRIQMVREEIKRQRHEQERSAYIYTRKWNGCAHKEENARKLAEPPLKRKINQESGA